jgi:competence protein ComEC
LGLVWQAGAVACGWFAWLALTYMLEAVRFFAALPLASLEVRQFNMAHAVLLYVMLGVFTWWLSGRSLRVPLDPFLRLLAVPGSFIARPLRSVPAIWPSLALSMAAALVWLAVFSAPDGRLTLKVLDVGQGDAILVDTPNGQRLLIDGGPNNAVVGELGEGLPFSERDIDLVVVTHPEQDHITGLLDVLDRYDVKQVMASHVEGDSETSLALRELIDEKGIEYTPVTAGVWIDLGRGARLQVLAPQEGAGGEPNDKSLVLKLTLGEVSFLLTGDIGFAGETALLANSVDLRATVLKVPHHGSAYATGGPLLAAVKPVVSVISVSADNTFGHPAPPTLDRLSDTIVYRTDEQGAVTFSTDGERLWVQPERNPPPPPLSMNR